MSSIRNWPAFIFAFTLLVFPSFLIAIDTYGERGLYHVLKQPLSCCLFFLVPLPLFVKKIKVYLYLLSPLVLLTPLFMISIFFGLYPGYKMIVLILQTNLREATEAVTPFLPFLVPLVIIYVLAYLILVHRISSVRVPFRSSIYVSILSTLILALILSWENALYKQNRKVIWRNDLLALHGYPFSLLDGVERAIAFFKLHNLKRAETFSFKAIKKDSIEERQVFVLIIGESSRYDRWQINGYHRSTSPLLGARADVVSFSNAVAAAHFTRIAVPQIITRANPDDFDAQFREKSVLCAFKEAGFKSLWLSNQSEDEFFVSGSIILHARTADVSMFSPTYSPNLELESVFDERLLPIVDSVLRTDRKNLFIVLHTMGSYWNYSKRYPAQFDVFKPSTQGSGVSDIRQKRRAILNAYDNSILYSDFIISSVIDMVNKSANISSVTFISDHGEDLFDVYPDKLNFHFRPSEATLRVPLFIWVSESYKKRFPQKYSALQANEAKKAGSENIFFSLLDIANIGFAGFDSTKSLASEHFEPSLQKYYDDERHAARLFSDLLTAQ